jgi:hypothetical protein
VTLYSAMAGEKNAISSLQNVLATPTFYCATTLTTNFGLGCATVSGYTNGVNAVKVLQTAKVPLWFGGMFHIPAFNIAASATASMAGGPNEPWNIAIILDTTSSMTSQDPNGLQCSGTQESCALLGVQSMLNLMYPCPAGDTCTTAGLTPVDSVSLFVFPPVLTSQAKDYYACPSTIPTSIEPYTFQNVTTGTLSNGLLNLPVTYTYQVVPTPLGTTGHTIAAFAYDYKSTEMATSLNSGSQTVIAAGAGTGNCTPGIQAKGGEGTYYAQAIYAAQAALVAEQANFPGSQNAMIILGDGDMNASSGELVAQTGTMNGSGSNHTYTYPSLLGQCGQAILAAQAVATAPNGNNKAGTRVYTVGYGAKTSGTCTTDASYSAYKGVQACTALSDMASSTGYFFSDNGNGCSSPNQLNFTKLTQIFQAIARTLTTARLIPNGTT